MIQQQAMGVIMGLGVHHTFGRAVGYNNCYTVDVLITCCDVIDAQAIISASRTHIV